MRKRNCRVEVCFTKDELSVLSKKAKKAGLSIGGFVRHSVADKFRKGLEEIRAATKMVSDAYTSDYQ